MTIGDIVNRIYYLTGTSSSSYPAADMLISVNNAYDRVVSLINMSDSKWQWDDTNQTDFPISTTALVQDQQDYSLNSAHLSIDRVEVKDTNGEWYTLKQIDQQYLKGLNEVALTEYRSTTGVPEEYDMVGSSIFLYPIPNYSQSASLKLYFIRGPLAFTSGEVTTGTKVPGFNSLFHDLLPLWASYDYAVKTGKRNINLIYTEIERKEKALKEFYNKRNRDDGKTINMEPINFL